jgi:4-alpha-glucanotransferase
MRVRVPGLHDRAAGVLCHPTSLPVDARRFLPLLQAGRLRWWQMLPVGPVGFGNSPYASHSAFAGSPSLLAREPEPDAPRGSELDEFRFRNRDWLPDWSLYAALKEAHASQPFWLWPDELRARKPDALAAARAGFAEAIERHDHAQWRFERQWAAVRRAAEEASIGLCGDLPIFVAHDSADVWAHPELFLLDEKSQPTHVAGVPPDYFSATGQRWGNPLYRWERLAESGYRWWIRRIEKTLERFHAIRLDHFIGFQRYWRIPADCPTAVGGEWIPGPGAALFEALHERLGPLPLIAEDLGAVTSEVTALRDRFDLPGIRILQFAFGTDPQAPTFKPHHYPRRAVVYTGTHDNDTVAGWARAHPDEATLCREYCGGDGPLHWEMIRALYASVADTVIVPLQDLFGLGPEARMNWPSTLEGNWRWQIGERALAAFPAAALARLAELYDR